MPHRAVGRTYAQVLAIALTAVFAAMAAQILPATAQNDGIMIAQDYNPNVHFAVARDCPNTRDS